MQKKETQSLGVIDALSGGFELVVKNPWVLAIPILLDLFLLLGPQISAKPLFQQIIPVLNASLPADASAETLQSFDMLKEALQEAADTFNLMGAATFYGALAIGFPTLFGIQPPATQTPPTPWLTVSSDIMFLAILLPLMLVGIFITWVFLASIAFIARRQLGTPFRMAHLVKSLVNTLLLTFIIAGGLIAFMIPLTLGAAIVSQISQGLASFVILIGMMILLWASLYLAFTLPAIFMTDAPAPQAMLNSVLVLRFDLWSAGGMIILAYLLRMGFAIVWQTLIDNTWGVVFDLLANAFLGSGLIAAMMLFYFDRITRLRQLHQQAQPKRT